ncbi:transcriptional activator RfaH [Planktomarina temperata]|nr:transcriptional activator RfaH [Planktomarina temperata]MDB2465194.1 transcriptional activator RfaH [Planktomarina temperata]
MSTKHWFLLQYKPNSHRLALRNLHRQGFETFLPMQDVTQRHSTKFVQQRRPLFPGYMFVSFALDTAPWRKINSTVGVARLVSFDGQPKALPPDQFAPGDELQVMSGPFAEYVATIETIDAEQRIWLLMEFMGQKTRMAVWPEQVQLTK